MAGIRLDLVAEIRRQIKEGVYETPGKVERTVDCLLAILQAKASPSLGQYPGDDPRR